MKVLAYGMIFTVVSALVGNAPALALTFVVNDAADTTDASPGDGVCADSAGSCTLRAAVQETNATPGADSILLAAETYTLTITGRGEDDAASGDLDISDDLSLVGVDAESSILDGAAIDRLFHVASGAVVDIGGVTIRNGAAEAFGDFGGGIWNEGTLELTDATVADNSGWLGGGIANFGTLTVVRCLIADNDAQTLADALGGGGIGSSQTLVVIDSLIANNSALGTAGGIGAFGSLTVLGSTLSGNSARFDGGGIGVLGGTAHIANSTVSGNASGRHGGGIAAIGSLNLNNVTVTANLSDSDGDDDGDGGGVFAGGESNVGNTIIAANVDEGGEAPDCGATLVSAGYNLIADPTGCAATGETASNLTGLDAGLGALDDNGGPTPTHALLAGSPAIDAGSPADPTSTCESVDQRDTPRPQDGDLDGTARCDIGAFEVPGTTQTVLGKRMRIRQAPALRRVDVSALERVSDNTVIGDPSTFGASLRVLSNGAVSSDQSFALAAQGWRRLGSRGFKYVRGSRGGAVKLVLIKRSAAGKLRIRAKLDGDAGTLEVVPPDPGNDGGIRLTLIGGATYCVAFGGGAGGSIGRNDGEEWRVDRPSGEGCPQTP